jgi:acyl-CoA reductase-like NAD-dependent aldehyde dehydrogenase
MPPGYFCSLTGFNGCFMLSQGKYIYERGSRNGKRVQSNMGAKNHGVVMPDANKENALNQLVGAAFGAAGQRCMALSTAVFVGEARQWLPDLISRAQALKVNAGESLQSASVAVKLVYVVRVQILSLFFL